MKKQQLETQALRKRYTLESIGLEKQKYMMIVFLDDKYNIVYQNTSYIDGIFETDVSAQALIDTANNHQAVRVIMAKNRPNGDMRNSRIEIISTKNLCRTLRLAGIDFESFIVHVRPT